MKDKRLLIVMATLMITFVGFGIIIPVMPELILATNTGSAELHTGFMLAIYSAVSFVLSPLWGGLSDRIGRRPVILTGVLGFAVSFLLFGLAPGNLPLMYASRVLGGLFSGAVTSVIVAYVADITPPEQRTKGMGLVGMSIGLGFTIGPGFGGLLSEVSLETPFYVAAGLAAITFLLAWAKLSESLAPERRRSATEKKPSRWTAFTGPLKYLYVLAYVVSFSLAGMEATLQFFGIQRFDVTPGQVGFMFFICGFVGALIQGGVVRRRIKKGEEPKYIMLGLIISAIGFFLLLFSHSLGWATMSLAVFGIGNALIRPCVTSLITQKTTVGQGVASGLSSSMDSLGRITGPLLGAFLFGLNLQLPYVVGGVLSLAALALLAQFRRLDHQHAHDPHTKTA
ncbi:multidrug resistance protein [Paenibacillus cellulosilyticus]|uniref:Multidrug resistance protein n=1 Tax=Paenibacillus cellulosilyticus TaxID=375489 RepID=A0A2V2YWZ0_9BACL|nr:MFS transporter [Paenibacillus cellulosilyticus]PWW06124.1 multidrug resistance protein [Paenibacillus cellulosilyticus]QKS43103.1 MFS transporter [Paenibacillus cellulosilyticus]